jgi:S-formylglutathione hydrolase FrmB
MKASSLLLTYWLVSCSLFEADTGKAETFTFFSSSINSKSTVLVYYPESYTASTPIIYLLNGWGTDAYAWGSGVDLPHEAYERNLMLVSLSAGSHTYSNNPADSDESYEDYVLEVVAAVEREYEIDIDWTKRALCGISNGGGGAVYLLSEHPDLFTACGSLSGTSYSGVENYQNFSGRGIRMDVGTEDETVLSQLRWQHNRFTEKGVVHEYHEHPGGHNWTFWAKYCPRQFDYLEDLISS